MNSHEETMRIAYLLKMFPRLSETFILNEIRGLGRLGVDVEIYSLQRPTDTKTHPAVRELSGPVHYVPSLAPAWRFDDFRELMAAHLAQLAAQPVRYMRTLLSLVTRRRGAPRFKDFLQAGALARSLRKHGVTHLHAHFANVPATVAELVSGFIGVSYSFTAHAKDIYLSHKEDLRRKMTGARFVLTCTRFNQNYLKSLDGAGTHVHLCYHGIDLQQFEPRAQERGAGAPVILSVGRFCAKKGFPYLIEACHLLKQAGHRFRCRIVGYGELRDELAAMISRLGLGDCVELTGSMTQSELAAEYARASLFVLPCLVTDNGDRDGIPNVLLEAMSMGVPVVSTDISGISEVVEHMKTGLLIPEKNAQAVAGAIKKLLEQPDLRESLAVNARARVLEDFSLESAGRRVFELFRLLDAGSPNVVRTSAPAEARV